MHKLLFFLFFLFGCAGILLGVFFFYSNKKIEVFQKEDFVQVDDVSKESVKKEQKLFVSAWVPYWATDAGIASIENHPASKTRHPFTEGNIFSEINPFAFEVQSDGTLEDRAHVAGAEWSAERRILENAGVVVVPTVLWGDAAAMHRVLSDDALRTTHIQKLLTMTEAQNFSGIDIDYEGKDVADKDAFSQFLREAHATFSRVGKTMRCTVEARDSDDAPAGFSGVRAMSWANDFSVLANECDEVRVMAYDQVFQTHRAKIFEEKGDVPYAPNADIAWAESVMRYALQYIPAEKLMLGVPTYGWEFRITKTENGTRYERVKAVNYPEAVQKAKSSGVIPTRNAGGEIDFVYETSDGRRLVNFSDAEAIAQKLHLAQSLGIKGVSIFKIDGESDPEMFAVL